MEERRALDADEKMSAASDVGLFCANALDECPARSNELSWLTVSSCSHWMVVALGRELVSHTGTTAVTDARTAREERKDEKGREGMSRRKNTALFSFSLPFRTFCRGARSFVFFQHCHKLCRLKKHSASPDLQTVVEASQRRRGEVSLNRMEVITASIQPSIPTIQLHSRACN